MTLIDDQIYSVVERERKAFQESADLFADKNPSESRLYGIKSQIYADLLPQKIDEGEYGSIVDDYISKLGANSMRDMGKVMGSIKKDFGIKLDSAKVFAMVKEKLSKLWI